MSFDSYAKNWDTEARISRAKIISEEIIKHIDTTNKSNAMEFGCGTGLISFNIHESFESITLVDSSKAMIDIVNDKLTKHKIRNMYPYYIEELCTEAINNKYDIIYSSMVLHHIKDVEEIIKTFYDLLNENGQLIIVDIDEEDGSFHLKYPEFDGHNGFDHGKLKAILIRAGFRDVEVNTFYYGSKVIEGVEVKYSLFIMKARKK